MRKSYLSILSLPLFALYIICAFGWGSTGHKIINSRGALHLPNSMSILRMDSLFYKAHASDADYRKDYSDTNFFAEDKRHYIDVDAYPNYHSLPHVRDSVVALYGWNTVKEIGTLPWSIQMVMDSLTEQFRRGDTAAAKYTMSDLGHYVGDAHQPLHCTENYDGQMTNNNGIHSRYETSMINRFSDSILIVLGSAEYIPSSLDFAFTIIYHSNSLVDSILQADDSAKNTSGWDGAGSVPAEYYTALWKNTGTVTKEQFQHATVALASLWYTAWVNAGNPASVDEFANSFPRNFQLEQNYPNPFNPTTTMSFVIRHSSFVSIRVFDVLGREVATVVGEQMEPGYYTKQWDATDFPSGVYFYRLQTGEYVDTRKLLIAK